MPEPRYAIYFAPSADSAIWRFGSEVIGYDAASGEVIDGFAPPGFSIERWRDTTSAPRIYGFHATLKAPFKLNGYTEQALMSALTAFCCARGPVDLGPMAVTALTSAPAGRGFVALTPLRAPARLSDLERDVVAPLRRISPSAHRSRACEASTGRPH